MSIAAWIVLGLLAGFVASKIAGSRESLGTDLLVGMGGAIVGGTAFHVIGHTGVTGFNLWSVVVSVIGAMLVLAFYHAVFGRHEAVR